MPQQAASLALVSEDATTATFEATFEGKKNVNPYDLWLALLGSADGVQRSASYSGLRWNEENPVPVGATCQAMVPKNQDPAHPDVSYKAYVWLFPDNTTPVSNTLSLV